MGDIWRAVSAADCDSYHCPAFLSNLGSGTMCSGDASSCDSDTCCYCSGWHVFDLGILCMNCGDDSYAMLAAVCCVWMLAVLGGLSRRCGVFAVQPGSKSQALLSSDKVEA